MFISNYLQLVYVKVCGKFIISKFLPVVVLPSGFMLVLQSTIPETWHLCNSHQVVQPAFSSPLALNMGTVLMLLMNVLS